ncbi:MAG: M20/M25/M40 family metallo-hydrolase [Chloroflexi bacterium]|nr:M20/M25/M40 family metallo-hydrolase [Chloroflexota bacterium]
MSETPSSVPASNHLDPVALTERLVRFNTSNPPGNEAQCIQHIKSLLDGAGIQNQVLGKSPDRPNLIARLPGDGSAPPLLLQGHVDVVPADPARWRQAPFGGDVVDGYLWGRGSLDMKSGIAMMLYALTRAKADKLTPAGDIVLAVVCDEEAGGDHGAGYLIENHPEQFHRGRYAIGEFGGFSFNLSRRRFYPIMVAEKQVCHLRATFLGSSGHASLTQQDNPILGMSKFLQRVQSRELPIHVTPEARMMFQAIGKHLPRPARAGIGALLNPRFTATTLTLLGKLLGTKGRTFSPLFRNTVTPTVVRGGEKINVAPDEVSVVLDGRLLPGLDPDVLIAELGEIGGRGANLEILRHDKGPGQPDMGLFDTLSAVLQTADPEGIPVPMLMPAATDGRLFARLGIQTYGFLPMLLPEELDFAATIHGPNERIPISAIGFGADAMYSLLQRYGRSS